MNAITVRVVLIIGGLAGFAGGALASWLLFNDQAVAQDAARESPPVVSAQEFRLVDQEGKSRAVFAFSADGEPYLAMLHRDGNRIIWLGVSDHSGLAVHDVGGKTRLYLSLDTAGEPSLVLRNRHRQSRLIKP